MTKRWWWAAAVDTELPCVFFLVELYHIIWHSSVVVYQVQKRMADQVRDT